MLHIPDLSGDTNLMKEPYDDEDGEALGEKHVETKKQVNHKLMHKMYLLRFRLLHFVNSLHNYIMTRVSIGRNWCYLTII